MIGNNQWQGQSLLRWGKSHTYRLVRIAKDERLLPHVGAMPSDIYTLSSSRGSPTSVSRR